MNLLNGVHVPLGETLVSGFFSVVVSCCVGSLDDAMLVCTWVVMLGPVWQRW